MGSALIDRLARRFTSKRGPDYDNNPVEPAAGALIDRLARRCTSKPGPDYDNNPVEPAARQSSDMCPRSG